MDQKCSECVHCHTEEEKTPGILNSQRPVCRRWGDVGKVPHPTTKDCFEPRDQGHMLEVPTEAPPLAFPARRPTTPARRTSRNKLQPGGFEGAFDGNRVLLTPKQVEFMERLGEQEEWEELGDRGEYFADSYAECLSDTMSPMAVGAMVTTLREKGVINSDRIRDHGKSVCRFKLTELGRYVYQKLSNGEVSNCGGIDHEH